MQSRSDDWRYNISKQIIANIRTKNAKISHNTSGIANGGVHFDWYFPNLYSNGNVGDDTDAKENTITSGGITYDQALINHLVHDKGYCVDYLGLTGKYFYSIGIDFTRKDESTDNVDYALAQGYKVRLNKIIESYKILMWECEALVGFADSIHEVPSHLNHIFVFYQDLKKRYKRILKAFSKNNNEFIKRSYEPDSYGLYSLANCFEDGYEYKKPGNHINVIQERPIYQDVFTNMQAPHKRIEQEIAIEDRFQQGVGLAPPPAPRPAAAPPPAPLSPPALAPLSPPAPAPAPQSPPALAPLSPPAPAPAPQSPPAPPLAPRPAVAPPLAPRPAPARSVSADTLMRIKLVGNEIRDGDRVTQNAEVTSTGRVAIPATIIKPILFRQFNQENNFWHNHQKSDGYRRGNDYLVLNKDYKKTGNIDIRAIEKIMAKVISNCQKHLDMKNDEVMRAITLAKKYGGLGNVANSEELLRDSLLTSVKPDQAPQAMLDKFRQFSFLVQRFNEDNGIYSGRKNGKLVGLRLTFVSENAISLWQENSRAIEARGGGAAGGVGAAGGSPPGRAGGAAAGGGGEGR